MDFRRIQQKIYIRNFKKRIEGFQFNMIFLNKTRVFLENNDEVI